jgi:hypothetical protein
MTTPTPAIASEREAIQLMPAISLPPPQPLDNHQLDCVAPARNDATPVIAMTTPTPVIASEREAIQLETGEKLRVPTPSLRGAKRRGNPASSCTTSWIASLPLAMTTPPRHRNDDPLPVIANEREAIQLAPAPSLPSQQPLANR